MKQYVCMDIGGTSLKYGLADAQGRFLEKSSMPSEAAQKGADGIVAKVISLTEQYQAAGKELGGVAISTAGMVDPETGSIVYAAGHFPGYTGTQLGRLVQERTGLPCRVENDVNAAGLGELWLGAGRGVRSLVCITVGTGIGGCVILDGQLVHGASYSAGEIGYLRIGEAGTLEELASTSWLVREMARRKGMPEAGLDGRQIFAWAQAGDAAAVQAVDQLAERLAVGIANVCYVLNPERVLLGGGIMAQQAYLGPRLQAAFDRAVVPMVAEHTQIGFASLGNTAGMAGALYNFLQRQGLLQA